MLDMEENNLNLHSKVIADEAIKKDFVDKQKDSQSRIINSSQEFAPVFDILNEHPLRVTVFGSARDTVHNLADREAAHEVCYRLAQAGYAVITGGGAGIMGAANRGASDAGGVSIGFNIKLPHEQHPNPYTTHEHTFKYFFTRKVALSFFSHAYIYFPGGFGTLDELFEIITLIQTKKMPRLKVILYGSEHWSDLDLYIKKYLLDKGMISDGDEQIYTITDDIDEIIRLVEEPEDFEANKEF